MIRQNYYNTYYNTTNFGRSNTITDLGIVYD